MQIIWNQHQEYVDYSALYPNIGNFKNILLYTIDKEYVFYMWQ